MPKSKKNIAKTIFKAIDKTNQNLNNEKQLDKKLTTILAGNDGILDSLGLVNLIINVEASVLEDQNIEIELLTEELLMKKDNPFRSIETLTDYIFQTINSPSSKSNFS